MIEIKNKIIDYYKIIMKELKELLFPKEETKKV
jgi:hypothetical protein